jgi:YggT family protein
MSIAVLLSDVLYLFIIVLFVRVIFSWLNPSPTNPIARLAFQITEPVLAPVRRVLPPVSGFDLSPVVVMVVTYFVIGALRNL